MMMHTKLPAFASWLVVVVFAVALLTPTAAAEGGWWWAGGTSRNEPKPLRRGTMAGYRGLARSDPSNLRPILVARDQVLWTPRGGAAPPAAKSYSNNKGKKQASSSTPFSKTLLPAWFRPDKSLRERQLSAALLVWNALAIVDAVRFTFDAQNNLRGYFVQQHQTLHPQVIVMTRFLANCQWAYLVTSVLVALTASNEAVLKSTFGIAILATAGAFRAVFAGINDNVIEAPWKTKYASLMTLPPLLLLSYFAFVF